MYAAMFSLQIFLITSKFLFSKSQDCENANICEIKKLSPRYILYDVTSHEGFNLRRDVYTRIAPVINRLNQYSGSVKYLLVLPPWNQLPHWRSEVTIVGPQENLPWGLFFNLESLKSYTPVLEFFEFLEDFEGKHLNHVFELQNFANLWAENFTWSEKWSIEDCRKSTLYYQDEAGIYHNRQNPALLSTKSFHCLSFQGPASLIEEILNSFDGNAIRFEHAEIMLSDYYGGLEHWKCRESMSFSNDLIKIASHFRISSLDGRNYEIRNSKNKFLKGDPYLCVHLRRRDFLINRRQYIPSLNNAALQIKEKLQNRNLNTVFVATDAQRDELTKFTNEMLPFKTIRYEPSSKILKKYKDGGVAIIEQIICSYAQYFIGSHESTFSFRIQEEREILNFDPETTFNRLCGDEEIHCRQPSKWLKPR